MNYRRLKLTGRCYFFTLNLAQRKKTLLTDEIEKLKLSIAKVKRKYPFIIDALVILPDHLHMLMTLPPGDADYSCRWNFIKGNFSRQLLYVEQVSPSRKNKRERGIWQRRFWEHCINDEADYEQHVNYIHYNPVKHGYVKNPSDWKYSSIHNYIKKGLLPANWAQAIYGEFGE